MIKEIVTDEAILSQPCEAATAEDTALAQDLVDTLESIDDASCLAANQIGVTKAMIAHLDETGAARVMLNPTLKRRLRPYRTTESCLSREEESKVTRFEDVTVVYDEIVDGALVSRTWRLQGWGAQIMQHMVDHCQGKLV